jgi:hypothetical protein
MFLRKPCLAVLLATLSSTATLSNKLAVEVPSGAVGEPLPEVTP